MARRGALPSGARYPFIEDSLISSGHYRGLTLSIFAGAFVFGIVMSSLGALLPALLVEIGFQKVDAGRLFLVMNFSMLVSSLFFGPICDRFGFRTLLLATTSLVTTSFAVMSLASGYREILGSLVLLGFGGGALNGGTNALLNDISPDRRQKALNLLGIFFGLGALVVPLMIGSLLERIGLKSVLIALGILTLGPFVLFLSAQFPAPKQREGFSWSACLRVLQHPLLYLFGFLLFFQSGNEFIIGGWASTYLGERFGMEQRNAAYVLAGYWTALILGRLAASRWGTRVSASAVVLGSALLALVGSAGMILADRGVEAALFTVLVGLGFAVIFPTTLAQAGATFADYSGTAFSIVFVIALSGGMIAPWLVGKIAQAHGLGNGFLVAVLGCVAIILIQACIRLQRKSRT